MNFARNNRSAKFATYEIFILWFSSSQKRLDEIYLKGVLTVQLVTAGERFDDRDHLSIVSVEIF